MKPTTPSQESESTVVSAQSLNEVEQESLEAVVRKKSPQVRPTAAPVALQVRGLSKAYRRKQLVLKNVNFSMEVGEAVALIGSNGCGKSTFLRCLLRLVKPTDGEVHIHDQAIHSMKRRQLRRMRAKVGLVFQKHNLVPRLTVLSNVIHGAFSRTQNPQIWFQGLSSKSVRDEAMHCLDRVDVAHLAMRRAEQLSGGESQRVAIARALMQRPQFMMADEPAASLDPKNGRLVMQLFRDICTDDGISLLFVSHHLDHALRYSDRVVGLRNGEISLDDAAHHLNARQLEGIYE